MKWFIIVIAFIIFVLVLFANQMYQDFYGNIKHDKKSKNRNKN